MKAGGDARAVQFGSSSWQRAAQAWKNPIFFLFFFFTFRRCQLGLDAGNAALLRQPRSCHAGNADESINLPEPRAASHVCEVNGIKPNKTGAWRKG